MTPDNFNRSSPSSHSSPSPEPKRPDIPPSSSSPSSRGTPVSNNDNDKNNLAFTFDIGKLFSHPVQNLGRIVWYGLIGSAIIASITGRAIIPTGIHDWINPMFWGSVAGKVGGDTVRGANDNLVTPVNDRLWNEAERKRSVEVDLRTGDRRENDEPEFRKNPE